MTKKINISFLSDIIIFLFFCNILGDALNLAFANIILILVLICVLLRIRERNRSNFKSEYSIWLISFTVFVFFSCFWAKSNSSAMNMAKSFTRVFIMMLFIYCETDTYEKLVVRIKQYIVATVFMMIRVILAYTSSKDRLNSFTQGAGLHFNTSAQILALSIILSFWLGMESSKARKRIYTLLLYCYIFGAYAMIVWSGSRKSIIIPLVGLVSIVLNGKFDIKAKFKYIVVGSLIAIIVLYFILSNDLLSGRFKALYDTMFLGAIDDVSAIERKYYRDTAWELFLQKPLLGWGANGFMTYLEGIYYNHVAYCHNNWLEILSSYGIIGGIIYYRFYYYLLVKLFHVRDSNSNMGTVLFSIVLVIFIFEFGIVTYYFSIYHIFFCFAAIYLKCYNHSEEREK